ncbi:MAG: hypothetical protein ACRDV2_14370 [Actinomycetes bacterium]
MPADAGLGPRTAEETTSDSRKPAILAMVAKGSDVQSQHDQQGRRRSALDRVDPRRGDLRMEAVIMPTHDQAPSQRRKPERGHGGQRVLIPTVEGDRRIPTYATVLGPDADNPGFVLVHTGWPVMGEHLHSIETADIADGTDRTEGAG